MARRADRRSTSRPKLTAGWLGAVVAAATPSHRGSIQSAIYGKTNSTASEVSATRSVHGVKIGKATYAGQALETYVQDRSDGFSVIAVLQEGQSSATFDGLLKPGQRLEPNADGGLAILDGDNMVGVIAAPWARDAAGRDLKTRYRINGSAIVQDVDATGAAFPIIADSTVKAGFHIVPVAYVQYTWSETWYVKNHIPHAAIATALLCSRTGPAAPYCAYYGALFINDVRSTTDAAIAHKRCLKMRLPSTLGAVGIPAYDSYYVTCTS